jgi:hypothetical protein
MIYVALYGGSLMESGRGAMDLFKRRGLTAIINDQLISNALMLASFTSAVVVGLLSYFYAWASVMDRTYTALVVGIGFLLGLVVCSIFMSIIDSAVATVRAPRYAHPVHRLRRGSTPTSHTSTWR